MIPPLWNHQRLALEKAKSQGNIALFFDVGTGKTRTAIEIMAWHYREGRRRALILCPPIVLQNWKREIHKYSEIPDTFVRVPEGTGKEKSDQILEIKSKLSSYYIVLNYEILVASKNVAQALAGTPFDILVCDELHMCKNPSAKRTKVVTALSRTIPHRYGLTGTPALNTPLDLFSQYKILLGGFPRYVTQSGVVREHLIDNYYHYRASFFYDKNAGMPKDRHFPKWELNRFAEAEIGESLKRTAVRIKRAECLDLPPFIQKRYDTPLTDEQWRVYKELKRDLVSYVNDKAAVAQFAITKALRLRQIASGFVKFEDESEHVFQNTKRLQALHTLLEELTPNHKVIVWAVFKQNYLAIKNVCAALDLEALELHGDITTPQKQVNVDRFQNDPSSRVMIANQVAGGIGVNLTASDYSIYFSRDFNLGADIQSEARNYRAGSEIHKSIVRLDLVAPGTIDELGLARLDEKEKMGEALLASIKEFVSI